MAKITIPTDCGNAPKKLFLKDYHIGLAQGDLDFVSDAITDDVHWDVVGLHSSASRSQFIEALKESPLWKVDELIIESIITHGKEAAVHGKIISRDQSHFAFCNLYQFKGSKGNFIQSMRTFLVQTNE